MKDINKFIISETTSIFEAASIIDQNSRQLVFVCRDGKLIASLSDGDIRRHIMKNGDFSLPVSAIANYNPKYLQSNERSKAAQFMRSATLSAMPILNRKHEIVAIEFSHNERISKEVSLNIPVVIMAGGKGSRLAPFTNVLPKPLIPIGDKTITEHIMERFSSVGCTPTYIIVNYKKELIKTFFRNSEYENQIHFIDEGTYWGTGGGLRLLADKVDQTFFMTNCDILLDADYEDILHYHKKGDYLLTMVCAMKKISVPYGTVELNDKGMPLSLEEKPEYSLLTNTGFYIMEPEFLQFIPENIAIGVPDVIQSAIDKGQRIGVYPVSEAAWMDMGQFDTLEAMQLQLEKHEDQY